MKRKNSKSFARKLFKSLNKESVEETSILSNRRRCSHWALCSVCKLPIIETDRIHRFVGCKHIMCLNCNFYVKKCLKCFPHQNVKRDFDLGKYTTYLSNHFSKNLTKKKNKIKKTIVKNETDVDSLINEVKNLTITKTITIKIQKSKNTDANKSYENIDNFDLLNLKKEIDQL